MRSGRRYVMPHSSGLTGSSSQEQHWYVLGRLLVVACGTYVTSVCKVQTLQRYDNVQEAYHIINHIK